MSENVEPEVPEAPVEEECVEPAEVTPHIGDALPEDAVDESDPDSPNPEDV